MSEYDQLITNNLRYLRHETRSVTPKVTLAFVTAEDLGSQGKGFTPPHYKHYYGIYDGSLTSIKRILEFGQTFEYVDGRITL